MHISWARLASFCHLGFISDPLIVSKFHNETHDPKGQENKIYTIVKGRETFYRRHTVPVMIQRWRGQGAGSPEKSQSYRVSKQYWSRSSEQTQSYQASIQCWAIISPPVGRLMMARFKWYLDHLTPINLKKRNVVRVGPPLTKLIGSAYVYVCAGCRRGHSSSFFWGGGMLRKYNRSVIYAKRHDCTTAL